MNVFNLFIDEMLTMAHSAENSSVVKRSMFDPDLSWERGEAGEIVLGDETALELGHPSTESLAILMWTDGEDTLTDGRITVIGPELNDIESARVPFARFTLIKCHGFTDENAYEHFQEMDAIRFKLNLKGQMLRAAPRQSREWHRISKESLASGMSLKTLGNELIREYKTLSYVEDVEMIFITSSGDEIKKYKNIVTKAEKITRAMNRIFENMEFDCAACDFSDVCDEIDGLREMHQRAFK